VLLSAAFQIKTQLVVVKHTLARGLLAALHSTKKWWIEIIGTCRVPIQNRAHYFEHGISRAGRVIIFDMIEQSGNVAFADRGGFTILPARQHMLREQVLDLRCVDHAFGIDVTLQPIGGNGTEALGGRLGRWEAIAHPLENGARPFARRRDADVGWADERPDLFALRVAGDGPKTFGVARLNSDPVAAHFWVGHGVTCGTWLEHGNASVGHSLAHGCGPLLSLG
jgi:hypothetical protein